MPLLRARVRVAMQRAYVFVFVRLAFPVSICVVSHSWTHIHFLTWSGWKVETFARLKKDKKSEGGEGVEAAAAAPTLPPKTLARPREQTEQVALT